MPVWGIWAEGAFYFSTGGDSVKGRNLAANPAICVHLESGDDTVILEGVVERVTDTALLQRLDEVYYSKYEFHLWESNSDSSPIYRLVPSVAFAWSEKNFTTDATRWQF
jgi:general stress protein 26